MSGSSTLPNPIPSPAGDELEMNHLRAAPVADSELATMIDGISMKSASFMKMDFDWPLVSLIEGKVTMSPAPSFNHQDGSGNLFAALKAFVATHDLGKILCAPLDWVVDDETVVQPDILWFPKGHPRIASRDDSDRTPPGLVVEILSPSNAKFDQVTKREIYRKAGLKHYWMLDPEAKTLSGLELRDGDYYTCGETKDSVFKSAPFEELELKLAEICDWE